MLVPFLGGYYYGAVLAGLQRSAAARGALVVAIQTKGTDLYWTDRSEARPLAVDSVEGFIAVNDFDSPQVFAAINERHLPLVCIGFRPKGIDCCSVLADNRTGARAAALHLIAHGHRRIGFVGYLEHLDIRERYAGYLDAHAEAGIAADPELLFPSTNNMELEGREVGKLLTRGRLPCTALMTGTDKNALGILYAMREAGHRIPQDLAVVGFDDIDASQYAEPPLSTVRQRFDLLGEKAAELLLDRLQARDERSDIVRVPAVFVARASCGCTPFAVMSNLPTIANDSQRTFALTSSLLELSACRSMTAVSAEIWPGAARIAEIVSAAADGCTDASSYAGLWNGFIDTDRNIESIERAMGLLEDAVRSWSTAPQNLSTAQQVIRHLRVELLRAWSAGEQSRARYYDFIVEANARINTELSGIGCNVAKHLHWLRWARVRYGCLARWIHTEGAEPHLRIEGEYYADNAAEQLIGTDVLPQAFPPSSVHSNLNLVAGSDLIMIAPIPGLHGNHGLLLIAGPNEMELRDDVGNIRDWAVLVGASLERENADERIRRNALRDPLTGLPNRILLLDRIDQAILVARRSSRMTALLLVDLDGFRHVNDSLGHLAGDRLLLEVTRRLQTALHEVETIARLSGDEFVVVLNEIQRTADVLPYVGRIQQVLREPFTIDGEPVAVSCSIGVAMSSDRAGSAVALLRDGDTALHHAKRSGRSRYQVFDAAMHQQALERLRLEPQLHLALDRNEFVLHYQPLIALASGQIVGAEALIRWNHPEKGILQPGDFLPIAEDAGLAVPISKWVLDAATREACHWRRLGNGPLCVNVNVPAAHFADATFVDLVRRQLDKYDLLPEALGLELVESTLIENQTTTIRVLEQLRKIGCHTAIDDFGTGYSSLSYLQLLPVSSLKIDRKFIRGVDNNPRDAAIASTIITMAHSLGLSVVAEGVETAAQLDFLKSRECDVAQGFLFSRPLSAENWRRFLSEYDSRRSHVDTEPQSSSVRASGQDQTKQVI